MPVSFYKGDGLSKPIIANNNINDEDSGCDAIWLEWETGALQGGGEYRDIALKRIRECLRNKNSTLDLDNLGLRSLPEKLPAHIERLILTNNQLSHLPVNFSSLLQEIYIGNNPIATQIILPGSAHQTPKIFLFKETAEPMENDRLFNREADSWQEVRRSGQDIRLVIEDEQQYRHREGISPGCRTQTKAMGLLAGVMLFSGAAAFWHNRWTGSSTSADKALFPVGAGQKSFRYGGSPAAEAVIAFSVIPPAITPAPLTEAEAIELSVINLLRKENATLFHSEPSKESGFANVAGWLFPWNAPHETENKVIKLARQILLASGKYGGNANEPLSFRMARGVIRNWVFTSVLGEPLRDYIANVIINDREQRYQTFNSIKGLLSLNQLYLAKVLNIDNISDLQWGSFKLMWETFIAEEVVLFNEGLFNEAQTKLIKDYEFLALYAGAEYLADIGKTGQFNQTEMISTGAAIWGQVIAGGDTSETLLPYLITPTLWFAARTMPERVHLKEKNYMQSILPVVVNNMREAQEQAHKIEGYLSRFTSALAEWQSKGDLAENIIAKCPLDKIMYMQNWNDNNLTQQQINKNIRAQAKERYLLFDTPPCSMSNIPASLRQEYARITRKVSDAYYYMDTVLIEAMLVTVNKTDSDFIFSEAATLYAATLNMKTSRTAGSSLGGMAWGNDIHIELNNTELFAVHNNNEKRIYGLKKIDSEKIGYKLHRLDKNIDLYIKNGILDHPHLWKQYTIAENRIFAGGYDFSFIIAINLDMPLYNKLGNGRREFIDCFSDQHRRDFYNELYQSGNDKSTTEKIWHTVKSIIPFYDCIEGLASGQAMRIASVLPGCFLDTLSLIPVVGQASALGGKFGLSLASGMRSGVLRASRRATAKTVISAITRHVALPSTAQMESLLKNTLRAIDPGVELLFRGGAVAADITAGISDSLLASKLKQQSPEQPVPPSSYLTARLPENGPKVSVKKVEGDRWVRVNPHSNEAFGKYFTLNNDQLKEIQVSYNRPEDLQSPVMLAESMAIKSVELATQRNKLPPAPGNAPFWNAIRETENWSAPPLSLEANDEIKKLEKFIPEPRLWVSDTEKAEEVLTQIIDDIYGPYPWNTYTGLSFSASVNTPPWIIKVQEELYGQILQSMQTFKKVRDTLWSLQVTERFIETDVGKYLVGVLGTQRPDVIYESYKRLTLIVERGYEFLRAAKHVNYNNFVIVSTDYLNDPDDSLRYFSALDDSHRRKSPYALVSTEDPEARLLIFADKFYRKIYAGVENIKYDTGSQALATHLTDTINHEITHLSSKSEDAFIHFIPLPGMLNNGDDIRKTFINNLIRSGPGEDLPIICHSSGFKRFLTELSKAQGIATLTDEREVIKAILDDPMLIANLMMSDAETLTVMIRDLAVNRPFDAAVRAKRNAEMDVTQQPPKDTNNALYQGWISIVVAQAIRTGINRPAQQ